VTHKLFEWEGLERFVILPLEAKVHQFIDCVVWIVHARARASVRFRARDGEVPSRPQHCESNRDSVRYVRQLEEVVVVRSGVGSGEDTRN